MISKRSILTMFSRLSLNGKTNGQGTFDWSDAFADASIMAGSSFMSTLAGLGATGLLGNPVQGICACAISGGAEFFIILALKRGLIKPQASVA
jgi:hypothetical protein